MKKKTEPPHEFVVPVRLTFSGHVYVWAESPEAALGSVNRGDWEHDELGSLQDWESTGPAKVSK